MTDESKDSNEQLLDPDEFLRIIERLRNEGRLPSLEDLETMIEIRDKYRPLLLRALEEDGAKETEEEIEEEF